MGRPLSEVLAPGYDIELLEDGPSGKECSRKRKRGNCLELGEGRAPEGACLPWPVSMSERLQVITRILEREFADEEGDEGLEDLLYLELYQHLVHFSVLDFTHKPRMDVFALGMALQVGPVPKLEILELGSQVGSEEEIEALADAMTMGHLPNLKFLNLSEAYFDDCDQVILTSLSVALSSGMCPNLEQLHLVENRVTDVGVKALSQTIEGGFLRSLKHLNLYCNFICVEGAKALASAMESGNMSNLVELELSRNCIGDEGAEALARALAGGKLRRLDSLGLWMNGIDVRGASALAKALESGYLSALTDLGNLDLDDGATREIIKGLAAGRARCVERLLLDHIDTQTAVELAKSVLEPGHLPHLQELRLTSITDIRTVEVLVAAYQTNASLIADLQVDWYPAPEWQELAEQFRRFRASNLTSTLTQSNQ